MVPHLGTFSGLLNASTKQVSAEVANWFLRQSLGLSRLQACARTPGFCSSPPRPSAPGQQGPSSVPGVACCSVTLKGCRKGGARLYDFADFLILTNLNVSSHMHPMAVVLEGSASQPPLGARPMDRNDFLRQKSLWVGVLAVKWIMTPGPES